MPKLCSNSLCATARRTTAVTANWAAELFLLLQILVVVAFKKIFSLIDKPHLLKRWIISCEKKPGYQFRANTSVILVKDVNRIFPFLSQGRKRLLDWLPIWVFAAWREKKVQIEVMGPTLNKWYCARERKISNIHHHHLRTSSFYYAGWHKSNLNRSNFPIRFKILLRDGCASSRRRMGA